MNNNFYTPTEMAKINIDAACVKVKREMRSLIALSILAGMYIAIGGACSVIMSGMSANLDLAINKVLSAVVFCIGIVAVSLGGAELFTGNIMMGMAFLNRSISLKELLKSWGIVWIFNFVGAIFVAWLFYASTIFNENMSNILLSIADKKLNLDFYAAFLRGIQCNILVCLAVWLSISAKDVAGKLMAVSFPVFVFVIGGFEHVVANMFYLPAAMMLGKEASLFSVMGNLMPVTIGNIIGGLILAALYHFALQKK